MLMVLIKSIITFFLVLLIVRLMGKRQLGEMQPFELVITLIIAEVACIPMNDPYIPFYVGVIPIITLGFLQILISTIARKSLFVRKVISGQSVIVIDRDGINYENLKKLNMNVNDLIEAARSGGYMDINEIAYAIFETNGNLCVVEKPSTKPPTEALLPITLIIDGKFTDKNLAIVGHNQNSITVALRKNGINNVKDVLYLDVRQDGTAYASVKNTSDKTFKLKVEGGNW